MREQENLDIVRRGYEAFGRGDLDGLLSLFDENIEWTTPGPSSLPTSGTRRGRAQVAAFFQSLNEVFEIQRFEPQHFVAQEDRVIVLGTDTSRVRATGTAIDGHWAHSFVLRNGKVTAFHEYTDTAAAVAELQATHAQA